MKKVGGLFACSALALMSFAALPLSAAELTHRWSFNGDYSDSAGGADAVKCGTYSAYVRDGGGEWWQFESSGGVSAFPLAAQSRALSSVTFSGDTTFASLVGNFWNRAVKGFRVIMR